MPFLDYAGGGEDLCDKRVEGGLGLAAKINFSLTKEDRLDERG